MQVDYHYRHTSNEADESISSGIKSERLQCDSTKGYWVKGCRGECIAKEKVQDLPERNSAENEGAEEAPEGRRSVEVMWLR